MPDPSRIVLRKVPTKDSDLSKVQDAVAEALRAVQVRLTGPAGVENGFLVDHRRTTVRERGYVSTAIPADDTVPQIDEGDRLMGVSYAPHRVGNRIRVKASVVISTEFDADVVLALFRDREPDAVAATLVSTRADEVTTISLEHEEVAVSEATQTWSLRIGADDGSAITVNGAAGARLLGGVIPSYLEVFEHVGPGEAPLLALAGPGGVARGILAWYDEEDFVGVLSDGGGVRAWPDRSGRKRDARLQGSVPPVWEVRPGGRGVYCEGPEPFLAPVPFSDPLVADLDLRGTRELTVLARVVSNTNVGAVEAFRLGNALSGGHYASAGGTFSGAGVTFEIDGVAQAAVEANDLRLRRDGPDWDYTNLGGTYTGGDPPAGLDTATTLYLLGNGSGFPSQAIRRIAIWNRRLSDAEVTQATTHTETGIWRP